MVSEAFRRVDENISRDEVVALMRGLQSFQSFPPNERPAMEYLADWFRERGLDAELIDVDDEPGRPDLVYRFRGSGGGKTVMFNGHLDIDPTPMNYPGDPWDCHEENGRLVGHGLVNMKAGIAAISAATVAIAKARTPLMGDVLMTAVVGELQGGVGAVDLVKRGLIGDCCIVAEPTDLRIQPQHGSASQWLIHAVGSSEWIGALHERASVNAAEQLAKVITALRDIRFDTPPRPEFPGLPRLIVGGINGGIGRQYDHWRASYVPDFCTAIVEVRGQPAEDYAHIREQIEAVLKRLEMEDPEFKYEIEGPPATYRPEWQSMKVQAYGIDLPREHYLNQAVFKHHTDVLGDEPSWSSSNAWNDSGHYTVAGCPSINYGPSPAGGARLYSIDIDRVVDGARIIARAGIDIANQPK